MFDFSKSNYVYGVERLKRLMKDDKFWAYVQETFKWLEENTGKTFEDVIEWLNIKHKKDSSREILPLWKHSTPCMSVLFAGMYKIIDGERNCIHNRVTSAYIYIKPYTTENVHLDFGSEEFHDCLQDNYAYTVNAFRLILKEKK